MEIPFYVCDKYFICNIKFPIIVYYFLSLRFNQQYERAIEQFGPSVLILLIPPGSFVLQQEGDGGLLTQARKGSGYQKVSMLVRLGLSQNGQWTLIQKISTFNYLIYLISLYCLILSNLWPNGSFFGFLQQPSTIVTTISSG